MALETQRLPRVRRGVSPAALGWARAGGAAHLLHSEQGYGDVIQFIRYAPLVTQRGGEVFLGCPEALTALLARAPASAWLPQGGPACPPSISTPRWLSLPAIFRTTQETLPAKVPYLTPPKEVFPIGPTEAGCLKAGLAWAGDAEHKNDRNRSMPVTHFGSAPGIAGRSMVQPAGRPQGLGPGPDCLGEPPHGPGRAVRQL